jgi:ketosteroid isomerase-like protein
MRTNEAVILEAFDAVEQRDYERLLQLYSADVEFVWPPSVPVYGGTYRGETEVRDMSIGFATAWDAVQPTAEDRRNGPTIIASNHDVVIVHYRQGGRGSDGQRVETEVLGLYTLADGKIDRLQMFYFEPEKITALLSNRGQVEPS